MKAFLMICCRYPKRFSRSCIQQWCRVWRQWLQERWSYEPAVLQVSSWTQYSVGISFNIFIIMGF